MSQMIKINGKVYELILLRILDHDEKGRPSHASIGYEDTTFDLSDDRISREFITAFAPVESIKADPKKAGS